MTTNRSDDGTYLINEVSRQVGLSQKRIREYEKEGLIKPDRESKTNNRRYTAADSDRIWRIKKLIHEHGFTLASLKYILKVTPCWIVFDCDKKETCSAYRSTHTPCYQARKSEWSCDLFDCSRCPIYLNRHTPKIRLLYKP